MNTDFLLGFGAGKAASGGGVDVEALSVTANGTYTAPTGKAYSPVNVNVPNSYAAADEGKVVSNGALVAQTSDTVTQNGAVDTTLINSLLVNVSGGGASNIVTGTFTGTTAGAAMDIDLPYTGSGYPIVVLIYPTGGPQKNPSDFYSLVQQYAIGYYLAIKNNTTTQPRYGFEQSSVGVRYKSSASSTNSYNTSSNDTAIVHDNSNANSRSASNCVKIRSSKKMSVFIAGTYYGFAANIEYTYYVIYSE